MGDQLAAQAGRVLEPVLGYDPGGDQHAGDVIRYAADTAFRYLRVVVERGLDLGGTDHVPGCLDNVVGSPDKAQLAVLIPLGQVAGAVP